MRPRFLFVSLLILFALWCTTAAPAQSIPQWQPNTSYAVGALVMYNGVEYQCIQAHTSEVGWEPPNTPALWQPVSGGGGSCSSVPSAPTGLAAFYTRTDTTTKGGLRALDAEGAGPERVSRQRARRRR